MADIRVNEVNARVRITDADALLSPDVMERIVREVMLRLEQEKAQEMQREADRSLRGPRERLGE